MADNGTWGWGDGNGSPVNQPPLGQDNNDGYDTWGDAGSMSSSEGQNTQQNDAWGSSDGWGQPMNQGNSDAWSQSDNWGAQAFNAGSQPNNGFSQEQGFGQAQNFGQSQGFPQGQDLMQGQNFANTDQMQPPKPNVKLSIPKACIVLAVLCVVIAGFVVVISSIKVKPKNQTQQTTQQAQQSQQTQQTTEQTQQTTGTNDVRLLYMAENATIDYSGDVYSTSGVVVGKDRFVDSNQLVYRIRINLAVGTESQTVNFYCNYSTFQSVGINDPVMVSYQQISNGFISINSVTK